MTAHASRLPNTLAALIAQAKHRMRRRRSFVVLAVVLVGLALGLFFALRSPSGGPGASRPLTSSVRAGDLRLTVPQGFRRYTMHGGIYPAGTRPPLIGYLFTNDPTSVSPGVKDGWARWDQLTRSGIPADSVGLRFEQWWGIGPITDQLELPLRPNRQWYDGKLDVGSVGYRSGFLRFRNMDYEVMYWSGPDAPAADRAAIVQALESIRPAR